MDAYEKLSLTDKQKELVKEFKEIVEKMFREDVSLVECDQCGLFAYNRKYISCFDAPEDAAYDNGVERIDITKLYEVFKFGMLGLDVIPDATDCLVAFDE